MSWMAQAWAESAPVADVYERAIITLFAHRADDDGCGCWPAVETIADFACCEERSVTRRLGKLKARGLIAEGDQTLVDSYPAGHRPVVYDLLIPYSWYSEDQMKVVTRERAKIGKPPLRPEDRPRIAPPPPRARRSDAGKPAPQRARKNKA